MRIYCVECLWGDWAELPRAAGQGPEFSHCKKRLNGRENGALLAAPYEQFEDIDNQFKVVFIMHAGNLTLLGELCLHCWKEQRVGGGGCVEPETVTPHQGVTQFQVCSYLGQGLVDF